MAKIEAKVNSRYEVIIPKILSDKYHIHPGDYVELIKGKDKILIKKI